MRQRNILVRRRPLVWNHTPRTLIIVAVLQRLDAVRAHQPFGNLVRIESKSLACATLAQTGSVVVQRCTSSAEAAWTWATTRFDQRGNREQRDRLERHSKQLLPGAAQPRTSHPPNSRQV